MSVSVPLPVKTKTTTPVIFMPRDGSTPIKYGVKTERDSKIRDIVTWLVEETGLPAERLRLCDVYQHK